MTKFLLKRCYEWQREDIVAADQLPETGAKSEHPFGFSILTAERTYELFTYSYQAPRQASSTLCFREMKHDTYDTSFGRSVNDICLYLKHKSEITYVIIIYNLS